MTRIAYSSAPIIVRCTCHPEGHFRPLKHPRVKQGTRRTEDQPPWPHRRTKHHAAWALRLQEGRSSLLSEPPLHRPWHSAPQKCSAPSLLSASVPLPSCPLSSTPPSFHFLYGSCLCPLLLSVCLSCQIQDVRFQLPGRHPGSQSWDCAWPLRTCSGETKWDRRMMTMASRGFTKHSVEVHRSPENGVTSVSARSVRLSRAVLTIHISPSSRASCHSVGLRQQVLATA